MTVTLQDVSMILALPIKGEPVCRNTASDGWREAMRDLIGNAPTTEKIAAGAPYSWIQRNFKKCPEGAEDEVVEMYARAYLWYVVSSVFFSQTALDRMPPSCGSNYLRVGNIISIGKQRHSLTCTDR
jgi:hypothetical protein